MISLVLDMKFLEAYLNMQPSDPLSEDHYNWLSFYRFLMSHEHYQVITCNKGKEISSYNFKLLLNQLRDPEAREEFFQEVRKVSSQFYTYNPEYPYKAKIENPHSLFFMECSAKESTSLSKHGYLFISSLNFYQTWPKLLSDHNLTVSPHSKKQSHYLKSWEDITSYTLPCNEILIVDPYLAINMSQVRDNILPLLKSILNPQVQITELTLIYSSKKVRNILGEIDNLMEPRILKKELESYFSTLHPHTINIRIIKSDSDKDLHDRMVITNYFVLSSGRSFQFFKTSKGGSNKPRISHKTTIQISYLVNPEQLNGIKVVLNSLRRVIDRTPAIEAGIQLKTGKNNSKLI